MLADSVLSELYRLLRNRMAVFWSVLFVPLGFAIGGIGFHILTKARTEDMAGDLSSAGLQAAFSNMPVNVAEALTGGAGAAANGAALVFMLIAAATLYAGDYRWETWRLISARNSRINLILGKVGALKILALIGIGVFLIAAMVFSISQGVIYGRPLGFTMDGGDVGRFLLLLLLSYLRLIQYAMIALLTAVLTRSLLAALFVPVVLGFAQTLLGGPGLAILGWEPTGWAAQLLLPGLAFDTLKAIAAPGDAAPAAPDGVMLKAIVSLVLWTLVPLAGAIAWFNRQDLSKE
jgi:ABC-2 type transport system permease protein